MTQHQNHSANMRSGQRKTGGAGSGMQDSVPGQQVSGGQEGNGGQSVGTRSGSNTRGGKFEHHAKAGVRNRKNQK